MSRAGHGHNTIKYLERLDVPVSPTPLVLAPIPLHNITRLNLFLIEDKDASAATTGLVVNQKYGMRSPGNLAGSNTVPWTDEYGEVVNVLVAGNVDPVSMVPTPPSSATPIQTVSEWNVAVEIQPEFIILEITQTDATNPSIIDLLGDLL